MIIFIDDLLGSNRITLLLLVAVLVEVITSANETTFSKRINNKLTQ